MSDVVQLLRDLVAIPSVSGSEAECRDVLAAWLAAHGVATTVSGRNVIGVVEGHAPGRGLLLCSHIDVVPVGTGWTRDPWDAALEHGRVWGRGANDAKSSVAAMAVAAARLAGSSFPGRVAVAFVCDEETGGEGIEACIDELPPVDATVVGEPTELDVCPGQRGMLKASVIARGQACHASRPWEGRNAIDIAAKNTLAIHALRYEADELLGLPTVQVTMVTGGVRSNVIPGECTLQLDGRSTPAYDNARLAAMVAEVVDGEVLVTSDRYLPVRTPRDAEIVAVAMAASPTGKLRAFGGVSDLFHLRHLPGVVLGPGTSKASHAPDEWVAVNQLEAAVEAYQGIAGAYLHGQVRLGRVETTS